MASPPWRIQVAKKKRGVKRPRSAEDIEDFIVDIGEANEYLRVLAYAFNKIGKTRFGATAPNPLIIDIQEEGTLSAAQFKDARVFQARTWQDIVLAYWYLKDYDHPYDSVVIDTVTSMADVCMKRVLKEKYEKDVNSDPKTPSQRDYGKQYQLMRDQLMAFRNLPLHMVLLAQERTRGNEDEGEEVRHGPDLPARTSRAAMGAVDVIGRIYQREVKVGKKRLWEPRMLVGPHESYECGSRIGRLPRIIKNPTVPKLIKAKHAYLESIEKED